MASGEYDPYGAYGTHTLFKDRYNVSEPRDRDEKPNKKRRPPPPPESDPRYAKGSTGGHSGNPVGLEEALGAPPPEPTRAQLANPDENRETIRAWREWNAAKGNWVDIQLRRGIVPKRADGSIDGPTLMKMQYGFSRPNIDIIGGRVMQTHTDKLGKNLNEWRDMTPYEQGLRARHKDWNNNPSHAAMVAAWGGHPGMAMMRQDYLNAAMRGQKNVWGQPWHRTEGGGYAPPNPGFQQYDSYGRPTGVYNPTGEGSTGTVKPGLQPNHYELNTQSGSTYPQPDPYGINPMAPSQPNPMTPLTINTTPINQPPSPIVGPTMMGTSNKKRVRTPDYGVYGTI